VRVADLCRSAARKAGERPVSRPPASLEKQKVNKYQNMQGMHHIFNCILLLCGWSQGASLARWWGSGHASSEVIVALVLEVGHRLAEVEVELVQVVDPHVTILTSARVAVSRGGPSVRNAKKPERREREIG
jgi:uncharacterized membrane protein YbjE (DUF340 family)